MNLFQRTRQWVADLRESHPVDEVFLVTGAALRYARSGNPFLALEVRDRTGRIEARLWENAEALQKVATVDGFVRIVGQVARFNDTLQVNITRLEAVPESKVDLSDFLPTSPRDPGEMERELREHVARIGSPALRALVESFFGDPEFWKLFRQAPAAQEIHHATVGGLCEHTLAVAGLCLDLCRRYPALDADLLLAGALLHDIGKTRELTWTRSFGYTDEGRLVGHLVLGTEMVTARAGEIKDFPAETLLRLRHMILSHHGQYDWGSPKRPKTLEAMALHFADDLDGKLNTMEDFLRGEGEPGLHWTPYHRSLGRYLYRGTQARPGTEG